MKLVLKIVLSTLVLFTIVSCGDKKDMKLDSSVSLTKPAKPQIDSIGLLLSETNNPSRVSFYQTQLAELHLRYASDSALLFANHVLNSERAPDDLKLKCSVIKAQVEYRYDSLLAAYSTLHLTEPLLDNVQDSSIIKSYALVRAFISELNLDYEDAITYNQLGLSLSASDTPYLARFEHNLGLAYKAIEEYPDAILHMRKSAILFGKLSQPTFQSVSYLELASMYSGLATWDSVAHYNKLGSDFLLEINSHYELVPYYENQMKMKYAQENCPDAVIAAKLGLKRLDSADSQMPTIRLRSNILLQLGTYLMCDERLTEALHTFKKALTLSNSQNLADLTAEAHHNLSEIYVTRNNQDSALYHLRKYIDFLDQATERKQLQSARRQKALFYAQNRIKLHELELQRQINAESKALNILLTTTIIAFIVIVVLYAAYRRKKLKALTLEMSQKDLELKLTKKSNELVASSIQLGEVKKRIQQVVDEVDNSDSSSSDSQLKSLNSLITLLKGDFSKATLNELDYQLKQGDLKLFQALSAKHPNLTRQDLRLCAFIRLNLSTKEIASITHQSENSIKVARYRLRNKLGVGKNQNITSFLNQLSAEFE